MVNETENTLAKEGIIDLSELRDKTRVFRDRTHAGEVLAKMLKAYQSSGTLVLGIPAGGVPVAAAIAKHLNLPLDLAIVSKITLPWNPEAGYGAVAFDGTVRLNDEMVAYVELTEQQVQEGIEKTLHKVKRRIALLRGERVPPLLAHQAVILVDDGLASGFTMLVAVEALRKASVSRLIVAVPTGHGNALRLLVSQVKAIYCPNVREDRIFAVADAYEQWSDVEEDEVVEILQGFERVHPAVAGGYLTMDNNGLLSQFSR
ncbi:phosphoribosyltransferase [Desulfovulcanus sp.]